MTDFASCESPSGFSLPEIDIVLQHNAAVSKGDVFVVPADHINTVGNVVSGGLLISAAVKKAGMVAVALDNYAANKPGYYRVQGICRASVKSLAGAPIVRGMGLVLGTLSESTETGQAVALALGIQPVYGVLLAVLWSGGVSLYQRIKQRREGWA